MEPVDDTTKEKCARILVIDDEEAIHASLKRLLGKQGHQVDAVYSAQAGIDLLQSKTYDLIITDLMMPKINGIELLEKLTELQVKLPVLMITGYPTIRTAMQAMRLGAVDYLAKPFRRQELLGPVNRMLRRSAADPSSAAAPKMPSEAPEDTSRGPKKGDRYVLRDHAWAEFQQDGTALVGIEESFLATAGEVESISLPQEAELVEQGYVGIKLETTAHEQHGVFMPLSGQVVAVNQSVAASPTGLDSETWLVQLVPSHLETEMVYLLR